MILFDVPAWLMYSLLFLYGAVAGSFLNVCVYRIPQHERLWDQLRGLWSPPSRCPRCKTRLSWRDNIPILGWLLLRGRCRYCKMRISPRYPLVELANALLFVVVYWLEVPPERFATIADSSVYSLLGPQGDPTSNWLSPVAVLHWRYVYHMVLLEALLVASLIDLDLRIIPDGSTLPAMFVGLLGGVAVGQVYLVPVWFQSPRLWQDFGAALPGWMQPLLAGPALPGWIQAHPHLHGLAVSLAGLLVGGGIIWAVRIIGHWVLKKEAMGFGDVILMAMIGSFLGWQPTLIVFFLAPACALVVVALSWAFHRDSYVPYGPFLSLATLLLIVAWQPIWDYFERWFLLGPLLIFLMVLMLVCFVLTLILLQGVKRMLGITGPPPLVGQWTAADQNQYLAGEQDDRTQGQWRRSHWPGELSSRGQLHHGRWRSGDIAES